MRENESENLKVADLEPGDELYRDSGHVHWVTEIGENRVMLEDVEGDLKCIEHSQVERDGSEWSLESRAPSGEGMKMRTSELVTKLQQAIEEQGDCEPYFVMEQEGRGYNPFTTFEYEIIAEDGGINIVCKNGSNIPELPHEREEDTE